MFTSNLGITIKDYLHFIEKETNWGVNYLPDKYTKIKIDCKWLTNLCNKVKLSILGNSLEEEKFKFLKIKQ